MTIDLTTYQRHIEHDLWHVDLAQWLRVPSRALWQATGGPLSEPDKALAALEEDVVMALQLYASAAGVGLPRGDGR